MATIELSKRQLLTGAAAIPLVALGSSLAKEATSGSLTKYGPDKSLDVLYSPKAPMQEYSRFQSKLRGDAASLAQTYVAVPIGLPPQGMTGAETVPAVNTPAIVELMLLLGQDQWGQEGRDRVEQQIKEKGLNITVGPFAAARRNNREPDTRYQMNLPATMLKANLNFTGEEATEAPNASDWQVVLAANTVVQDMMYGAVATDASSPTAVIANVGVGLGAGAVIGAATESMSRRRFTAATLAGAAGAVAGAQMLNLGGKAENGVNGMIDSGKSLGSSWGDPGEIKQLVTTDLVITDIRGGKRGPNGGNLIIQTRIKA